MQGVVLGLPADEFCERLSHDANGFGLISSLGKVELCGAHERLELANVGRGLAGEAGDQRGAQHDIWQSRANPGDQREERCAVATAPHRA